MKKEVNLWRTRPQPSRETDVVRNVVDVYDSLAVLVDYVANKQGKPTVGAGLKRTKAAKLIRN